MKQIIRLNLDGSRDNTFTHPLTKAPEIWAFDIQADQKILLGGHGRFGSFVYLICSSGFVLFSIIPIGVMVFLRTIRNLGYEISQPVWFTIIGLCAFLVVILNYLVTHGAIAAGSRSLRRQIMRDE